MNWRNAVQSGEVKRCSRWCLRAEGHAGPHRRHVWGPRVILAPGRCQGCAKAVWYGRIGTKGGPAWREANSERHHCRDADRRAAA